MQGATLPTLVVACCLVAGVWPRRPDEASHAVARSSFIFGARMYKELAKMPGNVFFSPLSVQAVLALTWLGARGKTASQIAENLHLPRNKQMVEKGFRSIFNILQNVNDSITLGIANNIYIQKDKKICERFQKSAQRNFLAKTEGVDFRHNTEEARNKINQWVENKTMNKIKDFMEEDSIDENTMMILVNAIYFKGTWLKRFELTDTRQQPFYANNTFSIVEMMHGTDNFGYAAIPELNAKILQLQYVGEQFSMLVLLPNKLEGLKELEAQLDGLNLATILEDLYELRVSVSLPILKLEETMELSAVLQQLGITNMFDAKADFTDAVKAHVAVNSVIQKSFLVVNEEGSEAAADSALFELARGAGRKNLPVPFRADHPFIFIIRENTSGVILFIGRFTG